VQSTRDGLDPAEPESTGGTDFLAAYYAAGLVATRVRPAREIHPGPNAQNPRPPIHSTKKIPLGEVFLVGSQEALRLKEPKKLSHNSLRLVLGDVVTTGVDLYDTHV
jgi:hypothetical protein